MASARDRGRMTIGRSRCGLGEWVSFCVEVMRFASNLHGAIHMLFRSMLTAFCRPTLEYVVCCHSFEERYRQRNCQRQLLSFLLGTLSSNICRQIGSASMGIGSSACRYGFTTCRKPTQRLMFVPLFTTPPPNGRKNRNLFPRRRLPIVCESRQLFRFSHQTNPKQHLPIESAVQHKHGNSPPQPPTATSH